MRISVSSFARAKGWFAANRWRAGRWRRVRPADTIRSAGGKGPPGLSRRGKDPGLSIVTRVRDPAMALQRRDALRIMAACMADWWLPRRLFGQRTAESKKPGRRVIVVTF